MNFGNGMGHKERAEEASKPFFKIAVLCTILIVSTGELYVINVLLIKQQLKLHSISEAN